MIVEDQSKKLIKADLLKGRIPILSRFKWPSDPVRRALMPWLRQHPSVIEDCLNDEPKAERLTNMIENVENCYQEKRIAIKQKLNLQTDTLTNSSSFGFWESFLQAPIKPWESFFKPPIKQKQSEQELRALRSAAKSCVKNISGKVLAEIKEESLVSELLVELGFPAKGWDLDPGTGTTETLKEIQKIARSLLNNEELNEIIKELGRLENTCQQEPNTEIAQAFERVFGERLLEFKSRVADIPNETRGIKLSGSVERMLPSEAGLLGNPQLKDLWYAKFAEKRLITYALEGTTTTQKTLQMEHEVPISEGSEKGPIIALIDTSGSMSGKPTYIAKAIVLRMCQVAFREKRDILLVRFGSINEYEEYKLEMNGKGLHTLLDFLQQSFNGGTDINSPVNKVLPHLKNKTWTTADIVIVSDGEFGVDETTISKLNQARQQHNVRVTGILIGNNFRDFKKLTNTGRIFRF
jgi:uncharacterized protein with von Willebrand factor type A (vWA) domain